MGESMERISRWGRIWRRRIAGILAVVIACTAIGVPVPVMGSEVWPQKSTAPFYCLDGGKGWKATDRYEIYQYHTLPSPLNETQARRLFWAYPSNWDALKEAARKYDADLYARIAATGSSPNVVKRVKDDGTTAFAWVADNPEIESRAIHALEQMAREQAVTGKEAPEAIRAATSEETAVAFAVPNLYAGPGAMDQKFVLGEAFVRDIAKIEAQSVWDNGSTGGNIGWLDASQDKNIAKAALGTELYELTWGGDSIRIHNNCPASATGNALGNPLTEEQKFNKTTVRYKITMRENSGWYTEGSWNSDYLTEWMEFKACVNAPGQQRLYKADIRIAPSDQVFYLVISQENAGDVPPRPQPEYGVADTDVSFQVYRHEETFEANYNVKLQKLDDETGMPLKGSQFYLYERFEDRDVPGDEEYDGGLSEERMSFAPWDGFQVFAEGITDERGEITHTDTRTYEYSKTYCDGHGAPEWTEVPEEEEDDGDVESEGEAGEGDGDAAAEEARDQNRRAAEQWMALYRQCEEAAESGGGIHFHWEVDRNLSQEVAEVCDTGEPGDRGGVRGADAGTAFEASGCRADCEETYEAFIGLRFTYTWKEVQARNGYILHDIHEDDVPIHMVTTDSSEAGAHAVVAAGDSRDIQENQWYAGGRRSDTGRSRWSLDRENKADSEENSGLIARVMSVFREKEEDTTAIVRYRATTGSNGDACVDVSEEADSGADNLCATDSDAAVRTSSNGVESASNASEHTDDAESESDSIWESAANAFFSWIGQRILGIADDDAWGEAEISGNLGSHLESASPDGIRHLDIGKDSRYSYAGVDESEQDGWVVRDHRTEGEIHINKRDQDLYAGESSEYSAYGDTEGDSSLEGAVYGLFAAEDIIHPDTDLRADGTMTNTGVVYQTHDLVSVSVTDRDGNASFYRYTEAPGMTFDYEQGRVSRRRDTEWTGPANRYEENREQYGNWWIGRPLLLGNYYVKELSRSEGYERSINGKTAEWTGYGSSCETPAAIADTRGMASVFMPEIAAAMEGEDEAGNGYDRLTFRVTSNGTTDSEAKRDGYRLVLSGFPENVEVYRVDSGIEEVTGPRVTGTDTIIVKDEAGNTVWKMVESDRTYLKYEPEYDETGAIVGQTPISRMEPQIQKAEQIPAVRTMEITRLQVDENEPEWRESVLDSELAEADSELFGFFKAELERVLSENGYGVPVTEDQRSSRREEPVFSMGVERGQEDVYGMTTSPGEPAIRTVYGAALQEIKVSDVDRETTLMELWMTVLTWYQEHPQWSFGGIHQIELDGDTCNITIYAGLAAGGSRQFFSMKPVNGTLVPDCVYTVLENPADLRWEYQEYRTSGTHQYQIDRQYYMGSGAQKRYYLDATLAPAVMIDSLGARHDIEHPVMVYHNAGEPVIDYLEGDPQHGYRVPETEDVDRLEITTELEMVEHDVKLDGLRYDRQTGAHTIPVKTNGTDQFGADFTDEEGSLTLSFMIKLPESRRQLNAADLERLGTANVYGYQVGDVIGYAEYLLRFTDIGIGVDTGGGAELSDTYIVLKRLVYRGQHIVAEDGDTEELPVQVLERPIKQKIRVEKAIEGEDAIGNFRFKAYLKSNLERLYRDEDGTIVWQDRNGENVDIEAYKSMFPELVQKLYTKKTGQMVLERVKKTVVAPDGTVTTTEGYNYEKFFDAVQVANTDVWEQETHETSQWNTSWKPFVKGLFTGIENRVNTSEAAKENVRRTDAVRQFAITWYLDEMIQKYTGVSEKEHGLQAKGEGVSYVDEVYDRALYDAVLQAEEYLKPFIRYDLDRIYEILWDSADEGGVDRDKATLAADTIRQGQESHNKADGVREAQGIDTGTLGQESHERATGISRYLPYGEYVIVEQQPHRSEWGDYANRHYAVDQPRELALPQYFDADGEVVLPREVPWTVTEPGTKEEMSGYADQTMINHRYRATLRIEKIDAETGEPILHDDAQFALYRAERNEDPYGDGAVKRYTEDTVISGSREFLEAMGARHIVPFAKKRLSLDMQVGQLYSGEVPAGTPICDERDRIVFSTTRKAPELYAMMLESSGGVSKLSTKKEMQEPDIRQVVGYTETPEPVEAGVYVLAELRVPDGYVRSLPIPVEVYSDSVMYYPNGGAEKAAAVRFEQTSEENGFEEGSLEDVARIYVHDTATSLEVSKRKTTDSQRAMKVSGRVEGTITELDGIYGLEHLELAYNSAGTYLGFGWKKGTLEYLENRKARGERVELVYEQGVFQGYGYVIRQLETADDTNRYVVGAAMALFKAIEVRPSGDQEDYAFEGVTVTRDRGGNVVSICVAQKDAEGHPENVPVLFYDLGGLRVLETGADGYRYGFDADGRRQRITFDTKSLYAVRDGRPVFEIAGGDFTKLVYEERAKAFTEKDEETVIYHLNTDGLRDALVDGYTGLAYVEKSGVDPRGREETHYYLWPITEIRNEDGTLIAREKMLSGRPGEKYSGTDQAYTTGTVNSETGLFEKRLNPVYDPHGMVVRYPASDGTYQKGEAIYDRDGTYLAYRYDDLLDAYNRAAYSVLGDDAWRDLTRPEHELRHRQGEAWMIPNIWVTGDLTPQDPETETVRGGQKDLLRRVIPGTYIMEELTAPEGYVRAVPVAVRVEETAEVQRVAMTDEKTKVEISKLDAGSGTFLPGVKLALYESRRVYTPDYESEPDGYYLEKVSDAPAAWMTEGADGDAPVHVEAVWVTGDGPKYFEGIPVGDYILEELDTPEGYVPSSMEITVRETAELQSIRFRNDYTKLEVYKYEEVDGIQAPLSWPANATLALYPALLDEEGNIQTEDGAYQHEEEALTVWTTGDTETFQAIADAYEAMFHAYGDTFTTFSWTLFRENREWNSQATRIEHHATSNGETITQLWETGDGDRIRITVRRADGAGKPGAGGGLMPTFEYQYHYQKWEDAYSQNLVSYDTGNGVHCLDYIPVGTYVLKELVVPAGYVRAEPRVIHVEETGKVQSIEVENRREEHPEPTGTLVICKTDASQPDKRLSGVQFEVRNLQSGDVYRIVTGDDGTATLSGLPVRGIYESGVEGLCIYEVREWQAPDGYRKCDDVWKFQFQGSEFPVIRKELTVENHETVLHISKRNFQTGHVVEGARLAVYGASLVDGVYRIEGEPLDTWISGPEPHQIVGVLSCGKTYFLVEEEVPDGYVKAKPVRFTVSADGTCLTDMTEQMARIQVDLREDGTTIDAISVSGRVGRELHYRLQEEEKVLADQIGTGHPIHWKDVFREKQLYETEEGSMFTCSEELRYSDGSVLTLERESFRLDRDSRYRRVWPGRYPISTSYVLKREDGVRIDSWEVSEYALEHKIWNRKNQEGMDTFRIGECYQLEEYVTDQSGARFLADRQTFRINADGVMDTVDLLNRETEIRIRKTDLTTGEELPGAVLTLTDMEGEIVDRWISGETEHIIRGTLRAGETYRLTEEAAPDGYLVTEEIVFTVSPDGHVDRVVMEDRRETVEEEPEEPDTPEPEPEKPDPEESEEPERPDPKKPEEPAQERTVGTIVAVYTPKWFQSGEIRVSRSDDSVWGRPWTTAGYRGPDTGDTTAPWWAIICLLVAIVGLGVELLIKNKEEDEQTE